jgi:hypothetical protein
MKVNCCPAPVEEAITLQTSGRETMLGASLLTAAPDRCRGKTISEGHCRLLRTSLAEPIPRVQAD